LVALLVVARELFLLRTKSGFSPTPGDEYQPEVLTFERSGWSEVVNRWIASVAVLIAMLGWWNFLSGYVRGRLALNSQDWPSIALDVVGITALSLLSYPFVLFFSSWAMDTYDKRVFVGKLTAQEREYLDQLWGRFNDSEDYNHALREWDRICREHRL
jgi:hypothetical protein